MVDFEFFPSRLLIKDQQRVVKTRFQQSLPLEGENNTIIE
jgi:hypothetical protein